MDALASIAPLAAQVNELQRQAARAAEPNVEHLIHARSCDTQEIEHTLDHLLDCACVPDGGTAATALW
ncbi:MAG: hypothetical protein H7A12_09555 [Pseudomonadales bacterium]|nr:hypothetical protein [Pseudomonadales bacterium]MCP5337342.1 hypothetical protein [Pseudomonadales bacterium]